MPKKPAAPGTIDPLYGNAPMPPESMTRRQVAEDLPRALRKAKERAKSATGGLSSDIERLQEAAWALSAHATLEAYVAPAAKALTQYSRAGAAKADADLHDLIVRHARRLPKDAQLVSTVHEAIGRKIGKRQIRRILLDRGVIEPRSKK
jgi:hypothetical protein